MPPKPQQSKADRKQKATKGTANVDGGFISFSDVVNSAPTSARAISSQECVDSVGHSLAGHVPLYLGSDPDLSVISKRLTKKNTTTRIKALSELKAIMQNRGPSVIGDFAPFFVFVYHRLVFDNDRHVRSELNAALQVLFEVDKPLLRSHIESLIGPWWMCCSDSTEPVSAAARTAFDHTFKMPRKRRELLTHLAPPICRYVRNSIAAKVETLSDLTTCSMDEADERFERVVTSSMLSLAMLISAINHPGPTVTAGQDEGDCPSSVEREAQEAIVETTSGNFWKKMSSKRPAVRRATLRVLSAVCRHCPSVVHRTMDVSRLTTLVCQCLSTEKHTANMEYLLQALTLFPSAVSTCWESIDLPKHLFLPLTHISRTHAEVVLPALLPLVATVPVELICVHQTAVMELVKSVAPRRHQAIHTATSRQSTAGSVAADELSRLITVIDLSGFVLIQLINAAGALQIKHVDASVMTRFLSQTLCHSLLGFLNTPSVIAYAASGCVEGLAMEGFQSVVSILYAIHRASVTSIATTVTDTSIPATASAWKDVLASELQKVLISGISQNTTATATALISLQSHAEYLSFLSCLSLLLHRVAQKIYPPSGAAQSAAPLIGDRHSSATSDVSATGKHGIGAESRYIPPSVDEEAGLGSILISLYRLCSSHIRMLTALTADDAPQENDGFLLMWTISTVLLAPSLIAISSASTIIEGDMRRTLGEGLVSRRFLHALASGCASGVVPRIEQSEGIGTGPVQVQEMARRTMICLSSLVTHMPTEAMQSLLVTLLGNIQATNSVYLWTLAVSLVDTSYVFSQPNGPLTGQLTGWVLAKMQAALAACQCSSLTHVEASDVNSHIDTLTQFLCQCVTVPWLKEVYPGNSDGHKRSLLSVVLLQRPADDSNGDSVLPWVGLTLLRNHIKTDPSLMSFSPQYTLQEPFTVQTVCQLVDRAFSLSLLTSRQQQTHRLSCGGFRTISSYESMVEELFPLLAQNQQQIDGGSSQECFLQVLVNLAKSLGKSLLTGTGVSSGDPVARLVLFSANESPAPHQWVEGASRLLRLCETYIPNLSPTFGISCDDVLSHLQLPTVEFWTALYGRLKGSVTVGASADDTQALQFVVSCLQHLGGWHQTPPSCNTASALLHSDLLQRVCPVDASPTLCVAVMCCLALCSFHPTAHHGLQCIRPLLMRKEWAHTPILPTSRQCSHKLEFMLMIIERASEFCSLSSDEAKDSLDCAVVVSALQTLVTWLCSTPTGSVDTFTDERAYSNHYHSGRRIGLDICLPSDDIPTGQRVYYMSTENAPNTSMVRVSAVPAVLVKIHRENSSEDPFYTLTIQASDGEMREIQTVANRILLDFSPEDREYHHLHAPSSADAIRNCHNADFHSVNAGEGSGGDGFALENRVEDMHIEGTGAGSDVRNHTHVYVISLCGAMTKIIHAATTAIRASGSTPTAAFRIRSTVNLLNVCTQALCQSVMMSRAEIDPNEAAAVEAMTASLRVLVPQLLRCHLLEHISSVKYGLSVFLTMIGSACWSVGFGQGLWVVLSVIPALEGVVNSFRQSARLGLTSEDRCEVLLLLVRVITRLLITVRSRKICRVLASDVLELALREGRNEVHVREGSKPLNLSHSLRHAVLQCLQDMWRYRLDYSSHLPSPTPTATASGIDTSVGCSGSVDDRSYAAWEVDAVSTCIHTVLSNTFCTGERSDGRCGGFSDYDGIIYQNILPLSLVSNTSSDVSFLEWGYMHCYSDVRRELVTLAVGALDFSLLHRRREDGVGLLHAAGIGVHSDTDENSMVSQLWRCMKSPHVHVSVRLVCMKVLDVLATHRTSLSSLPTALLTSTPTAPASTSDAGDTEPEEEEDQSGLELLRSVVGQVALADFLHTLQLVHTHTYQQNPLKVSWCRCCCGVYQESLLVTTDGGLSLVSPLSSNAAALSMTYNVDEESAGIITASDTSNLHWDWLGLVLQWLVILQRIDTFCTLATVSASHWGARAAMGGFLHHSHALDGVFRALIRTQQHTPFSGKVGPGGALTLPACSVSLIYPSGECGGVAPTATSPTVLSASRNEEEKRDRSTGTAAVVDYDTSRNVDMTVAINDDEEYSDDEDEPDPTASLQTLLAYTLHRSLCLLPILVRKYWAEQCSRGESLALERFVTDCGVNEAIVHREVSIVEIARRNGGGNLLAPPALGQDMAGGVGQGSGMEDGEMHVMCSTVSREVTATFIADEVRVELTIRLPALYPLRNVEVEGRKRLGISEKRWRRWSLQIIQLLSHQDGSVLDAVLLWKRNVDKEFEGVEPCPICYSILHPKTLSMPSLGCRTCNNKFHSTCLYKWFHSSGKSKCVLCQQPFF